MSLIARQIGTFSEKEVSHLFKKAKRVFKANTMVILCAPAAKVFGRILVITSGKIGKAHKRNLIRRRLKSIFYEEKLYEKQLDCIVIVKKEGINLDFKQLKKILHDSHK